MPGATRHSGPRRKISPSRVLRTRPGVEQKMAVVLSRPDPRWPGAIAMNLAVLALALVAALLAAAAILERPQAFAVVHEVLVQEEQPVLGTQVAAEESDSDLVAANRSRSRGRTAKSMTTQRAGPAGADAACPAPEAAPSSATPAPEQRSPRDLGDYPLLPLAATSFALA